MPAPWRFSYLLTVVVERGCLRAARRDRGIGRTKLTPLPDPLTAVRRLPPAGVAVATIHPQGTRSVRFRRQCPQFPLRARERSVRFGRSYPLFQIPRAARLRSNHGLCHCGATSRETEPETEPAAGRLAVVEPRHRREPRARQAE